MGLSRKRKQQLREITNRSLESRKLRKLNQENHRRKEILRRQREEEDFWDEYEDVSVESSSDESSFDEYSSEEEELMVEGGRGDNIQEGLGDVDGGVHLTKRHGRSMMIGNVDTFLAVYGYHNVTIMLLVMGWWS